MKVVRNYTNLSAYDRGAVVALGNFDGVHLGHQAVIAVARREAAALGVPLGVLVLEPHPQEFFHPTADPMRLTPMPAKVRLLEELGVDIVYVVPFDTEMASKLAPEFVLDVLCNGLGVCHVAVGHDFRYGRGRAGDAAALAYMGEMEGFGVSIVPPASGPEGDYGSTRVREFLRHGKPEAAAELLGRPWEIHGRVVQGDRMGRQIGYPTANLRLDGYLRPAQGIYAVRARVLSGEFVGRTFAGAAYVGHKPTFGQSDLALEVYLFDFNGSLYDEELAIEMRHFIRYDQKFRDVDALKAQMAEDCRKARTLLEAD